MEYYRSMPLNLAQVFDSNSPALAECNYLLYCHRPLHQYSNIFVLQMMPKVAAEVAAPLSRANKITMISDNQSDIGASKLTKEVLDIMSAIPDTVHKMTGVDIATQMSDRRS